MTRKYPKPVLCGDLAGASLYKESFNFEIKLSEHLVKNETIELSFAIELNSPKLINLIEENKAKAYFKIQTNRFSKTFECSVNQIVEYSLEKDILDRIDKIQISSMIVSSDDITFLNNDELIEPANSMSFSFKQGELLAISNVESLNYNLSGNPFINISLAESQEDKGLLFSSSKKEVIQIKVGKSLNDAYAKLQLNKDAKDILNPFLAFSAILYAIEKAIYDKEESYKEKDWYKILEQSFESDVYDSLEDFIESMNENFDVDVIYGVVQKILNNSLESRIRDVARRK